MSTTSATPALHRRSIWASPSSFSSLSSLEPDDTSKSRRFSSLRSSRPSSSSSRTSLYEIGPRPRTAPKSIRRTRERESNAPALSKRMSFMDFGDESSGGLLGSLKDRMRRQKSAASLRTDSYFTPSLPPMESPTTPTGTPQPALDSSPASLDRDGATLLKVDTNPALSFRDERKHTVVPENVVDGVGYGIRESHPASVADLGVAEDGDSSKTGFREADFKKRGCTLLHPYPRTDAPYMQSYNTVDLQNDAYFNLLLRRLNTERSPSFHEYALPPRTVLDLGCGQGIWVQEAAAAWAEAGTKVVGFDLVDLVSEMTKLSTGTYWKRGNFVAYRLPFKSASFDLVRLANLTNAVPRHRWEHVLIEVKRVLKPNGRVEIIDDEILFPYPDMSSRATGSGSTFNSDTRTIRNSWSSDESKSSDEIDEDLPFEEANSSFIDFESAMAENRKSEDSEPGLCRDSSPSEESCDYLPTPTEESHDLSTLAASETSTAVQPAYMPTAPLCQEIETIYETMLEGVYHINPKPADFLESLLQKVFGPAGKANMLKDFQLSLLDPVMHDLVVTTKDMNNLHDTRAKKLFKLDRDARKFDREKQIFDKVAITQSKSKALRVLGAGGPPAPVCDPISTRSSDDSDYNDEPTPIRPSMRPRASSAFSSLTYSTNAANAPRPSSSSSADSQSKSRYRPTGLFIFPDQFLETTPHELERHLCKHIDTVLGCKAALDEHVLKLRDDNGDLVVQEDDWHDLLWEYERSRRERFNLPDVGGHFDDLEDEDYDAIHPLKPVQHARTVIQPVATAIHNRVRLRNPSSDSPDPVNSSSLVRRIRVFEAYKIKPSLPH